MNDDFLGELLALEKKRYGKLNETIDVTKSMEEAVRREDNISVQMLLADRQKLVLELQEVHRHVQLKRLGLSQSDAEGFDRLEQGGEAAREAEKPVANQVMINRHLLDKLIEADRRVSKMLCREQSFYEKK